MQTVKIPKEITEVINKVPVTRTILEEIEISNEAYYLTLAIDNLTKTIEKLRLSIK